ncbi:MAG TPA: M48 family metalloprotease [Longimicrobiaceae bacterium]|nr:M48 family metalloprotease [Longimicrobiaceae bacterium]
MAKTSPSFAVRAFLAAALLAGFYLLAAVVVAALVAIPLMEIRYGNSVHPRIWLFCGIGVWAVINGVRPRLDRFTAPGPRVTEQDQPRLFQALRDVAERTGQAMPAEVYLLPDVNAWVAQRGGLMGFGSRRVMGIGLPLMQVLSVDELRGVIAHEFGHYHGGDTALGPWIYRTRAGVERTLHQMRQHSSVLAAPFRAYGTLFMRITQALSRRAEYAADALAASIVGPRAMIDGLKTVHAAGHAYEGYWSGEFAPALENGARMPMGAGLVRYMSADAVVADVDAMLDHEMREGRSDPNDSHPSLRERVAALVSLPASSATVADDRPSVALLDDLEGCEARLVTSMLKPAFRDKVSPATWDEAAERVWMPSWRATMDAHGHRLRGRTPASLAEFAGREADLQVALGFLARPDLRTQGTAMMGVPIVGVALMLALRENGFALRAEPGCEAEAHRDGVVLRPFVDVKALVEGRMDGEAWVRTWTEAGIADVDLGAAHGAGAVAQPA